MQDPVSPSASGWPASIARHGLPGDPPASGIGPLHDDEFSRLLLECEHHRLLGLLGAAVRAEVVLVTPGQHEDLERLLQAWLAHALRVERLLLDATRALDAAGLEHRVLKGAALAHLAYPDPAWRVFGDLDLLVPAARLHEAATLLGRRSTSSGSSPSCGQGSTTASARRPCSQERAARAGPPSHVRGGGPGAHHPPSGPLRPGATRHPGGDGSSRPRLPPDFFLHAAFSAVVGDWPPRLGSVRDVAQVLLVQEPDRDTVLAFARRWRAEPLLARALTTAWDLLEPEAVPPLVDWARARRTSRRERWLLAAHLGPGRASSRRLAGLAVLRGLSSRVAYLHAVAWPSRAYLERRGLRRRDHVCRGLSRLLPHRSPR